MRAVIQRVARASIEVNGKVTAEIGKGLLVFLGIGMSDTPEEAVWLARKTTDLRIFEDDEGRMNLSLGDVDGELLVVSQFTLYGDCRRGRRPGFALAAPPARGEKLYKEYCRELEKTGFPPSTGVFGAMMKVELINDGPVTLILEKEQ